MKLIKTNRAECHHIDDDDNFNLFDYLEEDFFSTEKAIKIKKEENLINEKERDKIFTNFMPAVKCLKRVPNTNFFGILENKNNNENNDENKKINNGTLYEFIHSEKFNIDLLIIYINKYETMSIIDTLIELMYQKYINQSLFYLPQLCMFFNYKEYYSSIESYILDRCVDEIKFSLQITWLLNSFIEDESPLIKSDVYDCLLQKIEETLVNGQRNTIKLFNQYNHLEKEEKKNSNRKRSSEMDIRLNLAFKTEKSVENLEILPFLEKQSRLLYFDVCNEFYSSLKAMCEDLKNYEKENGARKNKLMEYINNFNEQFEKQRLENEEYLENYPSFFGVVLPFNDSSSAEDLESNLIVRIIPEECFCFSTKARVPTKICAECIKVKELKNSEYLYNNMKSRGNFIKQNYYNENKLRSFQKRKTPTSRDNSLLEKNSNYNHHISWKKNKYFENDRLSYNKGIVEMKTVDEKGDKLKKFLYNINLSLETEEKEVTKKRKTTYIGTINENDNENENENDLDVNKADENEKKQVNINSEYDFEILPDIITEDIKNIFGKPMNIIKKEIQQKSPYKKFKSYKLVNFIAKANDDLRQELLTMQLIKYFDKIFKTENIPLHLHPYEILITSSSSGLLEFLENTSSIDGIKKKMITSSKSLCLFYKKFFKDNFEEAQINFTRSLAAYSLICYYLQIKDRHNGNILIDMNGYMIHIDFGFILGISPGGINFENAPFKLTKEYVEIMGGKDSLYYQMYKDLMVKGMIACKKYVDNIINVAEIMSKGSKMPCFDNKNISDIFYKFKERFYCDKKDEDFIKIVDNLINWSYDNFRTNQYDKYQKLTNGILP